MFSVIVLTLFLGFALILVLTGIINAVTHVPYVPSKRKVAREMARIAGIKHGDTILDLGSGDGRLLFQAARRKNITGIGFEIAPLPYLISCVKHVVLKATSRIAKKARLHFNFKSFFGASLKEAQVIFCYLTPNVLVPLSKKIKKECKKGTRIISNTFHIPNLPLKKTIKADKKKGMPVIYLYEI